MTVREAWNAIARAETEALGDHLTFASIAPILREVASGAPQRTAEGWRPIETEKLYHEIACPSLTKTGPCNCTPVIVADGPQKTTEDQREP